MSICSIESSKDIVKIGDTPSDMKEGVSANCAAIIGVTYGSHSKHDLINAGSTHIAHSVQELSTLILTLHNDN
jgi:phosphoglycolate phosphatase-like HAD superfamily hydrolase